MFFAVAWRRAITRRGVPGLGGISGRRIARRLGLSRWRHRSSRLAAVADQLAVVVADVADAMRHIEGCRLIAASIGSTADRGQGATLHSEVPAALLIGAGRQTLCICCERQPRQHRRPQQPRYYFHLQLHPFDESTPLTSPITAETTPKFPGVRDSQA